MSNLVKVIFAGTPEFAASQLSVLLSKHMVVGVLTQPDRAVGRGQQVTCNPVKKIALKHNIAIFQPQNINQETLLQQLSALNADIMVVVAYGTKLPNNLLKITRFGAINLHCSLLPRWRGSSPIQQAILAGDPSTGVTIIQMKDKIDSGDILNQIYCPIDSLDTTATLLKKLSCLGTRGILSTLEQYVHNTISPKKQIELRATYARKIAKEEAYIDWKLSACEIERRIRAFNPWPGCYFIINGKYIKVWKASILCAYLEDYQYQPGEILHVSNNGIKIATGQAILNIEKLQLAGKKSMLVSEFLKARQHWFRRGLIIGAK
ncbi:MAG: methionyl-tRNA formyltransferase [Candidatus Dasytiphilus stammeri]